MMKETPDIFPDFVRKKFRGSGKAREQQSKLNSGAAPPLYRLPENLRQQIYPGPKTRSVYPGSRSRKLLGEQATEANIMEKNIYTVSALNRSAKRLLENQFPLIWVDGEISNFVSPGSGHWYFSLKDKTAQIRCAMFRSHNNALKFQPENGMHVVMRAKVSLYEGRGDFQLIVNHMEEIGFGALQRAFEQLKQKLFKAGLFDKKHKKTLPAFPKTIGVVTSPTGAAIQDILSVLKRRFPYANVMIYPALVQGNQAADTIVQAIKIANQQKTCDVLLLARGGGSIEDLWPFNEEIVAQAIFDSLIPIVTGIGHEIDFTIADFVADHRAPTPSAAAEFITPDQQELLQQIQNYRLRLQNNIHKRIEQKQLLFDGLTRRLQQCHPLHRLLEQTQRLDRLQQALFTAQKRLLEQKQTQLKTIARALNSVSPLATLQRGYSIVTNSMNQIIKDSQSIKIGENITVRLAKGKLQASVNHVE